MDERIRRCRADDHVRLLARDRLEDELISVDPRAGAHELVAFLVAPQADRKAARLESGQGIREALQGPQRRLDEELAADKGGDGVPRQAEDEGLASQAEGDRLSRLYRPPPKKPPPPRLP